MRINILFEQDASGAPHGCSHIRLLRPLRHPAINAKLDITVGMRLADDPVDVVIVERWWKPFLTESEAKNLVREIRERNATFIYTLDDNLLDLTNHELGPAIPNSLCHATRYFLREADGVIVSTDALRERITRFNKTVEVIPNALDERLWVDGDSSQFGAIAREKNSEVVVIGYMGTLTHTSDFDLLIEPLRRLLVKHSNRVRLEVIGVSANRERLSSIFGDKLVVLDVGSADHYERFVPWFRESARWDIGLAPLTDTSLNACKSDIKFLDYGICGIPCVFSAIGPFPKAVDHGVTGLLASNDPESWFFALDRLVEDFSLRQQISANVRDHVVNNRTLKQRARNWLDAITSIRDRRRQTLPV